METSTLQRADPANVAGTMWMIDPIHSTIGFSVRHMVVATVHGRFNGFRGTIRFDREGLDDAGVEVEIDAATIDTGIGKRDDHLRSADFLNVASYPTIAFRSTDVERINRSGRESWLMVGDLTIHGVTRSVTLSVEQAGEPRSGQSGSIAFAAAASISRRDFGMEFNLPVVGDEVRIDITVQANRFAS